MLELAARAWHRRWQLRQWRDWLLRNRRPREKSSLSEGFWFGSDHDIDAIPFAMPRAVLSDWAQPMVRKCQNW